MIIGMLLFFIENIYSRYRIPLTQWYIQPLSPRCVHHQISSSLSFFVLWLVRPGLFFIYFFFQIISSLYWLLWQMPHQRFQRFDSSTFTKCFFHRVAWTRLFGCETRSPKRHFFTWSKFESVGSRQIWFSKLMVSFTDRAGNTVRKGENAGYQQFLLFPQCFQKLCDSGLCITY